MKSVKFEKNGLEGADVLSRLQMKKVTGGHGGGTCVADYTDSSGGGFYLIFEASGSCSQQSSAANSVCVDILTTANASGDSCHYDCGCDGWGS